MDGRPTFVKAGPADEAREAGKDGFPNRGTPKSKPETPKSKPAATKSKSGATKSKFGALKSKSSATKTKLFSLPPIQTFQRLKHGWCKGFA